MGEDGLEALGTHVQDLAEGIGVRVLELHEQGADPQGIRIVEDGIGARRFRGSDLRQGGAVGDGAGGPALPRAHPEPQHQSEHHGQSDLGEQACRSVEQQAGEDLSGGEHAEEAREAQVSDLLAPLLTIQLVVGGSVAVQQRSKGRGDKTGEKQGHGQAPSPSDALCVAQPRQRLERPSVAPLQPDGFMRRAGASRSAWIREGAAGMGGFREKRRLRSV